MIAVKEDVLRLAGPEDMDRVRAIVEDPDVAETFGPWPSDTEPFAFWMFDGGVIGAEVRADYSVYLHLAVLPWARGRRAVQVVRSLVGWLFEKTPCPRVAGWTPNAIPQGHMFNRMVGARKRGEALGRSLFSVTRREWEQQHG